MQLFQSTPPLHQTSVSWVKQECIRREVELPLVWIPHPLYSGPSIYCPIFSDEFSQLLSIICIEFYCVVILGDISNIHVDKMFNRTAWCPWWLWSPSACDRTPPQQRAHRVPNNHQRSKYFQGGCDWCFHSLIIFVFSWRVQSPCTQMPRPRLWQSVLSLKKNELFISSPPHQPSLVSQTWLMSLVSEVLFA